MIRFVFLNVVLFCFLSLIHAQNAQDSLLQKSKDELIINFNRASAFNAKEAYVKALVKSARKDKDTLYLITGYHIMAVFYKDERTLMYCDSIIALTQKNSDVLYPASAYLIKGNFYYNKRAFKEALDNYINANSYAKKTPNINLIFKSNYAVGILKDRVGEAEEAIALHRENFSYAKQHIQTINKTDYLNSVFALASAFTEVEELKALDSATFYTNYGIRESIRLEDQKKYYHFVLNAGTIAYYKKNFQNALDSIKKSLPYFEKIDNKPNMAVGYYYLGKLYFEFNKDEEAVFYLKKVDTVFQQDKDVLPKIRESYELLKNYYKEKNDPEQQLNYVEQLIKLDSILYSNEIYLSKNIIEEYDIPKLIAEKETIISVLEKKEYQARRIIIIVSIGFIITTLLLYYQYKRRKLYKKQAEALINEKHVELNRARKKTSKKEVIGISDEIIKNILSGLEAFEHNKGYLDSGINIHMLAKKINTNANYLSKVINHFKDLSFTNYINQLRVRYAINELKVNAMYRKFTIKALANEFGFNTGESFSSAFYKHTSTKPSYFIRGLDKH